MKAIERSTLVAHVKKYMRQMMQSQYRDSNCIIGVSENSGNATELNHQQLKNINPFTTVDT